MQKWLAAAGVLAVFLSFGAVAQADVIGSQSDATAQINFISDPSEFLGLQGNIFTLPALTGKLKSFDFYLSMSGWNVQNNAPQGFPVSVQVIFGGAGCPSASETYSAADLGVPVNSTALINAPALVHGALRSSVPQFSGQTGCTIKFLQNGADIRKLMATKGPFATSTDLYFTGFNAYGPLPHITRATLSSDNASSTQARAGDHIKVSFDVDEAVQTPQVTIAGQAAAVATTTGNSFEASTTLMADAAAGPVSFDIEVTSLLGDDGSASSTTDGSQVLADLTPPHLTADSRTTNELTPLIGGIATDTPSGLAGVSVTVNGSTYAASTTGGSWSVLLPNLPEGAYPIAATATDAAGNQSQASAALTIDRTAPVVAITGGPSSGSFTNQTSATFTFTSDTPALCSLDGGVLAACTSPAAYSGLSAGTHLFAVSASDEAGNTTTRTRSWSVDTAAPILKEVAIATSTSDTTPNYTFSSSKAGTVIYGGACTSTTTTAAAGDNTVTFNTLALGTYSNCTVTVVDAAGNVSAPLRVSTFTINAVVPPPRHPQDKDECKEGGWRRFLSPSYKNQGDCVSDVVSHKYKDNDKHKDKDD